MHSIVTTFRGAVIKVEVANFGAAMDTLIDQDALPLVLSLAGMSWMEGMPQGYLLFYTPLLLLICIALFQVYPTQRSSAYQSQGLSGCKQQRHISQLVSGLFPSLLSKIQVRGPNTRRIFQCWPYYCLITQCLCWLGGSPNVAANKT